MADNYYLASRRSPSPAESLLFSNQAFSDPSRRSPSPQFSISDRRNSQHVRRSSLEPVLESETRDMANQRYPVNHGASSTHPKPNLAKPRVPSSARVSHRVSSSGSLRNSHIGARDGFVLLAEVKTNVVETRWKELITTKITNEYLFMNELSYHLALRYGCPLSSIVVSLQHGICLLHGGSFDPAYILTITGRKDQITDKRNVTVFQDHLQQAIRVTPARGLVQIVAILSQGSKWAFRSNSSRQSYGASGGGQKDASIGNGTEGRR
ncbi:hypothetical protein E4U17_000859 [Claviceps sp. LM77 group G4]|nr:hypothetical protein E4U17_000859 [Claviceps sp. LM77 group G4]KAG6078287.1 hypothetical protein E4U33_000780 [Claviceps sp. LM78 group G4]